LIVGLLIKFVPARLFDKLHMKEESMTDEEEQTAFTTQFRKSFRQSKSKRDSGYDKVKNE